jgi:hypothetical protein
MWQAVGGQNPLVFSFRYDIIRKRCQYRFFPGIYSRSWKSGVSAEYPAAIYLSTASAVKEEGCNGRTKSLCKLFNLKTGLFCEPVQRRHFRRKADHPAGGPHDSSRTLRGYDRGPEKGPARPAAIPEHLRTHVQLIFSMLKYNTDKQALYNFVRERQEELRSLDQI